MGRADACVVGGAGGLPLGRAVVSEAATADLAGLVAC